MEELMRLLKEQQKAIEEFKALHTRRLDDLEKKAGRPFATGDGSDKDHQDNDVAVPHSRVWDQLSASNDLYGTSETAT